MSQKRVQNSPNWLKTNIKMCSNLSYLDICILTEFWQNFKWTSTNFRLNLGWISPEFWLDFDCISTGIWLDFDDWISTGCRLDFHWISIGFWLNFGRISIVFWRNFGWISIGFRLNCLKRKKMSQFGSRMRQNFPWKSIQINVSPHTEAISLNSYVVTRFARAWGHWQTEVVTCCTIKNFDQVPVATQLT